MRSSEVGSDRRCFLAAACCVLLGASTKQKRFVFKIRTKSGGIIGNIVERAKSLDGAKVKVRKRYPECEFLESEER